MILENNLLRLSIDDNDGSITGLFHKKLDKDAISNNDMAENFRLSVPLKTDWTNIVIAKGQKAEILKKSQTSAELYWESLPVNGKSENISVRVRIWLEEDELRSTVTVENASPYNIDYVWYPILGGVTKLCEDASEDLYQPHFCGIIHEDLYNKDWIDENNRYWYTSREFKSIVYPKTSNMQFCCLAGESCGLYFSSKDNRDFHTGFYFEHERARTPMTISIVKAPFIIPGESAVTAENVLSFYSGDWHAAAGKYYKWLASWMHRAERSQWVKELDGWLAFQGHCGDMHIAHPFEEYPKWMEKAQQAGLSAIHIHCGVHEEGIEGGYPYWNNISKRMGGKEKLLEVIDKIHQMGGRVITFTKDNKVNLGLPEYEEKFSKYAVCLRDGANPRVSYSVGTLDLLGSGAQLAVMCRGSSEWQDFIVHEMASISKIGFDGNMIDEWCSGLDLCFSHNHGHEKPTGQISGQHELGKTIRCFSKENNPDYLLAGEELWDACYEYMDISFSRGGSSEWWGRDPRFYEIFRYSIPDIQCTAEILENEYGHLNYAFACGYMLILCIDYYHSGPEAYPEFASYFSEVIRIRKEVRDYFLYGDFRDDLDYRLKLENGVFIKSFRYMDRELIIVYSTDNSSTFLLDFGRQALTVTVRKPFINNETLKDVCGYTSFIPRNSVVVLELT